ncbi:XkdW family protein [Cytobacillus horneckiae]|uniref:XkdW family protein n=1 Tax=Cytobacillus horneckiae TaxID=549687 RepID=UPI003D9A24F5
MVDQSINFESAIRRLFPEARPNIDYIIVADFDGVQEIKYWGYDAPQPSIQELQIAWEEHLDNPPIEPPTPAEELQAVKLQLASVLKINAEKEIELQTLKEQNASILVDNANKAIDLANIKQQNAEILKLLAENNIVGGTI